MNRTPENGMDPSIGAPVGRFKIRQTLLDQLFTESRAASWALSRKEFTAILEVSAKKRFVHETPAVSPLEEYLSALHLQDLALACACAEGHTAAWDYFVSTFRDYLRSAAAVLLRCPANSPAACELADSLFADLYGVGEGPNRRSLFRYFHGRSSLKTWLRAVLAQRHVDAIRAGRRFTSLDAGDILSAPRTALPPIINSDGAGFSPDPHRAELVALFHRTLEVALGLLEPLDKERLRLYYAAQQTLAEIGRKLGEHESSVSRNLDRTRRDLRRQVEQALRRGVSNLDGRSSAGLSEAQIALCFEYASEDAAIDLDKLLPESQAAAQKPESKKP